MSLMSFPTCDICGGFDLNDLLIRAYDRDTQEDLYVCPDCFETNDLVDADLEADFIYEKGREEGWGC